MINPGDTGHVQKHNDIDAHLAGLDSSKANISVGNQFDDDVRAQLATNLGDPAAVEGASVATVVASASVAKGALLVNVKDYGAKGDGSNDDTAAITAAINALSSKGGTVYFPASTSYYRITSAIPLKSSVTYLGASSAASEIRATAGSVFAPTGLVSGIVLQGLTLRAQAGHVIDLGTGSNGVYQTTFRNCAFVAGGNGVSIVNGNGACTWQEVYVQNSVMTRLSTAAVPGVNLISSVGGLNGSKWENLVLNGAGATGTPFWHVESSAAGTYVYDCSWVDIIGEQNPGGLLALYSGFGCRILNMYDYDVSGSYTASLVYLGKTTGPATHYIDVNGLGNRSGTVNGTSVYHLEMNGTCVGVVTNRIYDQASNTFIKTGNTFGSGVIHTDGWGISGNMATQTASATLLANQDGTVAFNGTSLTATLPDPTTVVLGRKFTIKNVNASALTVVSAGTSKTIDGAASQSLSQWANVTVVSDGTQWLIV